MATVSDICRGALRKLDVVGRDQAMTAEDADDALDSLNRMLAAWKLAGVDITHTTLALDDTFPLADEYEEGTVYMLASRLAPEYTLPQTFDADDFFRKIQAAYMSISTVSLDTSLTRLPSRYWPDTRLR